MATAEADIRACFDMQSEQGPPVWMIAEVPLMAQFWKLQLQSNYNPA